MEDSQVQDVCICQLYLYSTWFNLFGTMHKRTGGENVPKTKMHTSVKQPVTGKWNVYVSVTLVLVCVAKWGLGFVAQASWSSEVTLLCLTLVLSLPCFQPSRAEHPNSTLYGYCQANNSQQRCKPKASIACQTKLHASMLVSALHQPLLVFFSPENKLIALSACYLLRGNCGLALLNQQICGTLESNLHAQHPKVNVPAKPPTLRLL